MHFLFWTKRSHKSTNCDIFKHSGENVSNSSCHFPNQKSMFLQILHDSSLSRMINPLYFSRSNVTCFGQKGPIKGQIFETFECSDQNSPNFCNFWKSKLVFLQILHHSSLSWDKTPRYFSSWSFLYFQQKEPFSFCKSFS